MKTLIKINSFLIILLLIPAIYLSMQTAKLKTENERLKYDILYLQTDTFLTEILTSDIQDPDFACPSLKGKLLSLEQQINEFIESANIKDPTRNPDNLRSLINNTRISIDNKCI